MILAVLRRYHDCWVGDTNMTKFGLPGSGPESIAFLWGGCGPFCDLLTSSGERGQEGPSSKQEPSKETQHLGCGCSQKDAPNHPNPIAENLDALKYPNVWDAKFFE